MSPRICVCDDDPVVAELLSLELRGAGMPVSAVFADVEAAKRGLNEYRPEVLLLDLHMPGGGGLEVLRYLRSEGLVGVRVIMLTGEGDAYFMDEAKRLGARGYLTKPVQAADLVAKVHRVAHDDTISWIDDLSTVTAQRRAAVASAPRPAVKPLSSARPLHVLSVEDVTSNQQLIALFLEDLGYVVDKTQTGGKALSALQFKQYDVVLVDMHLPDMSGLDVVSRIRRHPPAGRRVPIVAVSADTTPERVAQARAAGVDEYVFKPFTATSLQKVLQRWAPWAEPVGMEYLNVTVADLMRDYGREPVQRLLATLSEHLSGMSAALTDRAAAAEAAHAIKGAAAMLGFERASLACVALEDACRGEGTFDRALAHAVQACGEAREEIAACLGPQGSQRKVA